MEEITMPKASFDALMKQISTLQATVDRLTEQLSEKNQIILNQSRAGFGQSSEKRTYLLCDGQTNMFDQAGDGITEKAPEAAIGEKRIVAFASHSREYLCAFLDGEVEISNNQVKTRSAPLWSGENWLFCDTQAGANASVIIFTVLETAKANGLTPEAYLSHLLSVLPERFVADPQAPVLDLMPWDERIQEMFSGSGVEH